MNKISEETARIEHLRNGFRPQQGLTIMNFLEIRLSSHLMNLCFRPQQGLTIMNLT